jgi:DNA-binding NtrC family response regulator
MTVLPLLTTAAEDVRLAAHVDLPVLITSGNYDRRNLYARLIHLLGPRGTTPFVSLRAEPHGEGARAADDDRLRRHLDAARGGTLFVDDVLAIPPAIRQLLTRLLESDVARGGEPGVAPRSIRLISGASRRLVERTDLDVLGPSLYYRLNVIHINLLPEEPDLDATVAEADLRWRVSGFMPGS